MRLPLARAGVPLLALAATATLTPAAAQDVPQLLFCTVDSAQVCQPDGGCAAQATLLGADLPLQITIDVPDRVLASPTNDGWTVVTPMGTLATAVGQTIMQGIEGGFAWSVAVDADGQMSLTSSSAFVAVSAFGSCTTE